MAITGFAMVPSESSYPCVVSDNCNDGNHVG